ncbi:MAG: hypothetical protein IT287_06285 [Bdellovibrionaceae bacterium]|nr:hypothetical protein [Pseudobdellovibrionaceae bacterium]
MAKNNKKFDFVVIGDSLPAVLAAVENSQQGLHGAIFCGSESLGGLHRGVVLNSEPAHPEDAPHIIDTHMNYVPNTPAIVQFLNRIKAFTPTLEWTEVELGPITFHNGMTQPFLGFGAQTVDAIDFYSYFTSPQQLKMNLSFAEILTHLVAHFKGEVLVNNEVTSLIVQDGMGTIQTNGTDTYTADRIYYFESSAKLGKVIPTESPAFSKANVQRLSKSQHWAAVNLTYWHKTELTESAAVHILYGAKDLPCLGIFSKTTTGENVSQWMSILSSETFADTEQLGLAIREMKKQIKRMYGSFFESTNKEFIVVSPEAFGSAPPAVSNNPDLFKNDVLFLGSQHYASDMALLGEASSYLALVPFFKGNAEALQEQSNT